MQKAEPADFTEFMHARWSSLFRTAYLLTGNAHDAEELLQDAMARTCVKWRGIRDKPRPTATFAGSSSTRPAEAGAGVPENASPTRSPCRVTVAA